MPRISKTTPVDLSQRQNLTVGAIERLACPPDKAQAFMRDSEVRALRVRVTSAGAKSFVFETKLNRQTIRRTIGDVRTWTIEQARAEARRLAALVIRDKVEGERVIPLCPYVHHLLTSLPRRGEWVFQSAARPQPVATPRAVHLDACRVAGIEHLTLHGLRRSFGGLAEWLELPAGVTAQIMGHKPGATAEKHYRVRPLDLLRVHHGKLERWILEQAGVPFDASEEPGKLRAVIASIS